MRHVLGGRGGTGVRQTGGTRGSRTDSLPTHPPNLSGGVPTDPGSSHGQLLHHVQPLRYVESFVTKTEQFTGHVSGTYVRNDFDTLPPPFQPSNSDRFYTYLHSSHLARVYSTPPRLVDGRDDGRDGDGEKKEVSSSPDRDTSN